MKKNIINILLISAIYITVFVLIIICEKEYNNRRLLKNVRLEFENAIDRTTDPLEEEEILKEIASIPSNTPLIIRDEFLKLRNEYQNEDIIGFLKIEGTSINYPVLQAQDNEYYLNHDIRKDYYIGGSVFLDYENDIKKADSNTIIYGHNMKKDIMFHSLRYYQQKDYFEKHRYIIFNTLYEEHIFEIFAFMKVRTDFDYITVNFKNKEQFYNMLKSIKQNSLYDTGVEISANDRILSLSTCADVNSQYRFVVSAKRVSH